MQLAPSSIDLRVAVPVTVAWIATALLIGVPDVAPVVAGAAALLTGVSGIVLRWRRGTGVVVAVAGLLLVAGALTTLLAVSVTAGSPGGLRNRCVRSSPVRGRGTSTSRRC